MAGKRYIQVIVRMTVEEKCQAIWLSQRLGMTLSGALRSVVAEKYAALDVDPGARAQQSDMTEDECYSYDPRAVGGPQGNSEQFSKLYRGKR